MFSTACIVILLAAFPGSAPLNNSDRKQLSRFDGTWELVARQYAGKEETSEEIKKGNERLLIKDGFARRLRDGKLMATRRFTVSDNYDPPLILIESKASIEFGGGGNTLWGVYELKADSLRLCHAITAFNCPKDFTTKEGDYATLETYRRVKE